MLSRNHRYRNINLLMLARVMGWLLMIESAFMLVPMVCSLIYGEADWQAFAISVAVTAGAGLILNTCIHQHHTQMGKREGFLLTACVWVVFSLFGSVPFVICSTPLTFSEAFFEAMSGFTTTGASVLPDIEHMSQGVHMWRALMQWIGGMGIIIFTLAVIPMLNYSGGMQMFNAEVTGITHDKIRPRISQTAKSLWGVYGVLTALCTLMLWVGPMTFFDALCHAFGTVSTGGFSTRNAGISSWDSAYVDAVVTLFMFLGGVNFALLFRAATGNFRTLRLNETFRVYVWCIAVYTALCIVSIIVVGQCHDWRDVTIDPLFLVVSTITSTGYTVANFELWGVFVLSLMFVVMFFGACAGSTSGGAKIDRMIVLMQYCRNEIRRALQPNSVTAVRMGGKAMSQELVSKVIAFLCLFMIIVTIGGILLSAMGIPVVDSFFSAFSCMSNIGLGAGVTGYGSSYEIIPDAGKWLLSMLMLIGRLEIFTVLILLTPNFWHK